MTQPSEQPVDAAQPDAQPDAHRVVVVGPGGMALQGPDARPDQPGGEAGGQPDDDDDRQSVTELVGQPAKVMRVGSMIKQLLEEVRNAPLDDASRVRLREIHQSSIKELEQGLAPELIEELERLTLPFTDDEIPTDAELRIAQAQLVG